MRTDLLTLCVGAVLCLAPSLATTASSEHGQATLSVGTNFASLDSDSCCSGSTVVPPDPEIAVGPDHIVVVVNNSFEIYNKLGGLLAGPIALSTLFDFLAGDCVSNPFYPSALYDASSDRFVIAADADGAGLCVAASKSSNPTGDWWMYGFPFGQGDFLDWPQLGIGRDAIFAGGQLVVAGDAMVYAMDKHAMYQGQPAASAAKSLGGDFRYARPLELSGPESGWPETRTHYFVSGEADFGVATLFSWTDPFGTNQFSSEGSLDLAGFHGAIVAAPIAAPQAGGETIGGTTFGPFPDFEYNNGNAWIASHVSCNPGGGIVDCVQWAQVNLTTPAIIQAGLLATDDAYRIYPDLAVNRCGDTAIGYTRTSSATFPSIWAAGRLRNDTANSLQAEVPVKAGEITYQAFDGGPLRWGEYTGMTLDPDGSRFWYAGQYSKANGNTSANFGTWVASMAFGECDDSMIFADGFESGNVTAWTSDSP